MASLPILVGRTFLHIKPRMALSYVVSRLISFANWCHVRVCRGVTRGYHTPASPTANSNNPSRNDALPYSIHEPIDLSEQNLDRYWITFLSDSTKKLFGADISLIEALTSCSISPLSETGPRFSPSSRKTNAKYFSDRVRRFLGDGLRAVPYYPAPSRPSSQTHGEARMRDILEDLEHQLPGQDTE